MLKPTLYMICGLPGSGKSTLAAKLEQTEKALRLTPDVWMSMIFGEGDNEAARDIIEKIQWDIAKNAFKIGTSVILESGFWSKREREEFRRQAEKLGAEVKLYYMDIALEEIKRRIGLRNQVLPEHTFYVNLDDIDNWSKLFEPPTADEMPIKISN